ncbi:hypothetical protein VAE122_2670001 [Vibrio aestuarianus]|nr:hypothetical protein VAE122_2670001 [Vibrio aestuarianus]
MNLVCDKTIKVFTKGNTCVLSHKFHPQKYQEVPNYGIKWLSRQGA